MSEPLAPKAMANRLSVMLTQVLGAERFPVAVAELALDYSRQCFPSEPIEHVRGEHLEGFEGMLMRHPSGTKWLIMYNGTRSQGRQRFTIAHEFGHYLLHRHRQAEFNCGLDVIESGDAHGQAMETEADEFAATLLMPLDDFRAQVAGQLINFDLLGRCADRYGVSLTAAALRWLDIAPGRAVLVVSRDDFMLWAKSSRAAFKSGAYFATRQHTIELPSAALAHSHLAWVGDQMAEVPAQVWFEREPETMMLTEMTKAASAYDQTLTLLLLPPAERVWSEPVEEDDDWQPGRRRGPPPVRNLNRIG